MYVRLLLRRAAEVAVPTSTVCCYVRLLRRKAAEVAVPTSTVCCYVRLLRRRAAEVAVPSSTVCCYVRLLLRLLRLTSRMCRYKLTYLRWHSYKIHMQHLHTSTGPINKVANVLQ